MAELSLEYLSIQSVDVIIPLVLNETQPEQDNDNTKQGEIGSYHTTHPEQVLRNLYILLPKSQTHLITTLLELSQVKGKVVVPKQRIQPTNDHNTRSKTSQPKSVPDKSLRNPKAGANSDTLNHFIPQQEQRKKADVAQMTENKSTKHFKGIKISAETKKQKQRFNFENKIEIEPNSETDQPEQLDCLRKNRGKKGGSKKSQTEPKQTVIFLVREWNLTNAIVKTKPKKWLLLQDDPYYMRRQIKTGTELTVKPTAKFLGKLNYQALQFEEATFILNIMDDQKAKVAILRGCNTSMIMNKTAIPDIN
ncbi:MAG: hypothetical protein EZS28_020303 [Streblomastix strix]|uniref:Uncharacterized protein n=1 Tax=Streblomastix strix TaxID=222440 RepID=A0A5J4VNI7_9EUKA|nr:MAG: hypothetical protein EZS28_020303 [Streblomastix strix]